MPSAVPLADQIKCVAREMRMRRSAHPRFVAAGKMRQEASDREIHTMEAVLATLTEVEAKERLL